ncbi:MAG TPA: DUF488 domain-containing protein [Bdellovibrionota bacterium]|nr:DUF488 domain-containing protein [Bdellovibrionota bacterium]
MIEHNQRGVNRLLSIGHSNHSLDIFLKLLKRQEIEVLVDARSQPYSRFSPHFNRPALEKAITNIGIKYLFMGEELGGRPTEDEFYDSEGHVLYARLAESPQFLEAIARLETGLGKYRVALLCSEEDPTNCHRRLLVSRVLATRGISVNHIRGDGRIETEKELQAKEGRLRDRGQKSLFASQEENVWRSIQSVSQRGRRQSSSRH